MQKYFEFDESQKSFEESLIQYLSGDNKQSGYQPIGCLERLKTKYKNNYEKHHKTINDFLYYIMQYEPNWDEHSYSDEIDNFKNKIRNEFPWLANVTIDQLGNYFAYQWK